VTDGRTDGQNYDSEDRAGIAASHGKNGTKYAHCHSSYPNLQAVCVKFSQDFTYEKSLKSVIQK